MNYDLEDRTKKFSLEIIRLVKPIKPNILNRSIVNQLIRSATSVGANYCEANSQIRGRVNGSNRKAR